MKTLAALLLCLAALTLAACRPPSAPPAGAPDGEVDCDPPGEARMDPANVTGATIDGDILRVVVQHDGGCADHTFTLHGCAATLKSNPLGVPMTLAHDAHGDACEAWITDTLEFSVRPVREQYARQFGSEHGELILHVSPPLTSSMSGVTVRYRF
jgi:hypothetical protein